MKNSTSKAIEILNTKIRKNKLNIIQYKITNSKMYPDAHVAIESAISDCYPQNSMFRVKKVQQQ